MTEARAKRPNVPGNLGLYLRKARDDKKMSLRDVEAATEREVSNAYLSQLESGKIAKPSPHILYALSSVLDVEYEALMIRAGYISTSGAQKRQNSRHGKAATYAIENLTSDEEAELLRYLKYYRSTKED